MVRQRAFRADLFYRLNVFPIRVPPLRERRDDIPLLVRHFVRRFADRQGKVIDDIPEAVMDALAACAWPGNVRELQNIVERAVVGTTGRTLRLPQTDHAIAHAQSSARTLAEVELEHILATLRATNGVIGGWNGAAARLGLSRTTLISRMQRLGIQGGSAIETPSADRTASAGVRARRPQVDAG